MREHIIFSGRMVPVQDVDRGRLLLGDPERWFRAQSRVTMRCLIRRGGLRMGMYTIPVVLLLLFGQWRIAAVFFALYLGVLSVYLTLGYLLLARRTLDAYRSTGLSPGLYENGIELPAYLTPIGLLRVRMSFFYAPWSRTVFLPFAECEDIDTQGGALAGFLQDTITIRLRGGGRLWFPTGLLGEDGLDHLQRSHASGAWAVAAHKAARSDRAAKEGEWSEVRAP